MKDTKITDLKIGQKIVVSSTAYYNKEVADVRFTWLADAYELRGELEIEMTPEGHWGCIPTRGAKNVAFKKEDIRAFLENCREEKKESSHYFVNFGGGESKFLSIVPYDYDSEVVSLKDGKIVKYSGYGSYNTISVTDKDTKIKENLFDNLEDAYKRAEEIISKFLTN